MALPSGLSEEIGDDEKLSIYLFQSNHFSRENRRVKSLAFVPYPHGDKSSFRIDALTESQIWDIGEWIQSQQKTPKTLYGRGDIVAASVKSTGLSLQAQEPPPRHANLIGWTQDDKSSQMEIAHLLSASASLVLKN